MRPGTVRADFGRQVPAAHRSRFGTAERPERGSRDRRRGEATRTPRTGRRATSRTSRVPRDIGRGRPDTDVRSSVVVPRCVAAAGQRPARTSRQAHRCGPHVKYATSRARKGTTVCRPALRHPGVAGTPNSTNARRAQGHSPGWSTTLVASNRTRRSGTCAPRRGSLRSASRPDAYSTDSSVGIPPAPPRNRAGRTDRLRPARSHELSADDERYRRVEPRRLLAATEPWAPARERRGLEVTSAGLDRRWHVESRVRGS